MTYEHIQFVVRGAGAWITLNRPKHMNSITAQMLDELGHALAESEADAAIRAVVLTGAEVAFCSGADLKGVLSSLKGELNNRRIGDLV